MGLAEVLRHVVQVKPHVAILMGPFVDEAHGLVRDGQLEETYDEVRSGRVYSSSQIQPTVAVASCRSI